MGWKGGRGWGKGLRRGRGIKKEEIMVLNNVFFQPKSIDSVFSHDKKYFVGTH